MKHTLIVIAIAGLFSLTSAHAAHRKPADTAPESFRAQQSVAFPIAPRLQEGMVRSPADCAPSLAQSNWHPESGTYSYTCVNGGN